jgi:hypothetical protein
LKLGVPLWSKHLFRCKRLLKKRVSFSFLPTSMEAQAFGFARRHLEVRPKKSVAARLVQVEFIPEEAGIGWARAGRSGQGSSSSRGMNPKGPAYGLNERTKAKAADAPDVNPAGMSAAPHLARLK